jgi:hypothetical protein
VFLASPSDLSEERRAAKDVVDGLSRVARVLGVTIELLGWEDTLAGARRPQDLINAEVDKADLFIGMLWHRWGQPTGNPQFSSGFEEEFYRTLDRRTKSGEPEMWLFFKDVPPAQLQDPGQQLQSVLLFKNKCETEKRILFKKFKTMEDWNRLLRDDLLLHMIGEARRETGEPAGDGSDPGSVATASRPTEDSSDAAAPSLQAVVDTLNQLAKGADPQELAVSKGGLYAARLYLIGLSLLADSGTSSDLASTHEINTLYRHRDAFDPLRTERSLLERTVLADRYTVKPGWFWFPQEIEEQISVVGFYSLFDNDFEVRRGALTLLTKSRTRRDEWCKVLFTAKAAEMQKEVADSFWAYLETIVVPSDRELIEKMALDGAPGDRATKLLLLTRISAEPGAVLAEMATAPDVPPERLLHDLIEKMPTIDQAVLTAAFASRHEAVRMAVATELHRRHRMDEIRAAAQDDSAAKIRTLEYRDRLEATTATGSERPEVPERVSYEDRRELELERLRGLSYEELQNRVGWLSAVGSVAYEVLARDHWDAMADQVRADIRDNFDRIREQWIDRFAEGGLEKSGFTLDEAKNTARMILDTQIKEDTQRFIRQTYAAGALAAIAEHGAAEDAPFVRRFLHSTLEGDVAIRALKRVGDKSDVPALIQIAQKQYDQTKELAAAQAVRLSDEPAAIIQTFSESNSPELVRFALATMSEVGDESSRMRAIALLRHENVAVREVAADFVIKLSGKEELTALLDSYVQGGYYYYNVMAAIDRALYCRLEPVEQAR